MKQSIIVFACVACCFFAVTLSSSDPFTFFLCLHSLPIQMVSKKKKSPSCNRIDIFSSNSLKIKLKRNSVHMVLRKSTCSVSIQCKPYFSNKMLSIQFYFINIMFLTRTIEVSGVCNKEHAVAFSYAMALTLLEGYFDAVKYKGCRIA